MLKGIDVSMHQAAIDLSAVSADFVIVKATEGMGYTDPQFKNLITQAVNAGKRIGVYHFCRNDMQDQGNTAIGEADWFLSVVKDYIGKAILVLDWESKKPGEVSYAKVWLDRVYSKTGIRPMIYMNQSTENSYDWSSVVNANYGLWGAKYLDNEIDRNYDMSKAGSPFSSKFWDVVAMWQWTSSGILDGWPYALDCNVFYGDGATWDKYAGGEAPRPQPVPVPTPQPCNQPKYSVGTPVCTNILAEASTGGKVYHGDWLGTITEVVLNRPYPYLLNNGTGWTNDEGIDSDPHIPGKVSPAIKPTITAGSKVRVKNNAKDFNGGGLASFVYHTTYTLMELNNDRAVIGNGGTVTAAVHVSDLYLA